MRIKPHQTASTQPAVACACCQRWTLCGCRTDGGSLSSVGSLESGTWKSQESLWSTLSALWLVTSSTTSRQPHQSGSQTVVCASVLRPPSRECTDTDNSGTHWTPHKHNQRSVTYPFLLATDYSYCAPRLQTQLKCYDPQHRSCTQCMHHHHSSAIHHP